MLEELGEPDSIPKRDVQKIVVNKPSDKEQVHAFIDERSRLYAKRDSILSSHPSREDLIAMVIRGRNPETSSAVSEDEEEHALKRIEAQNSLLHTAIISLLVSFPLGPER